MPGNAASVSGTSELDTCASRVYVNEGNVALLEHVPESAKIVLDVGCGSGDNAARLKVMRPGLQVHGLTLSSAECDLASSRMEHCWVCDVERDPLPEEMARTTYDVLLLSHVLEHLRHPSQVLARLSKYLRPGGHVLIAVPNILHWRQRFRMLGGSFEYTEAGVMDQTHLKFYTYRTADKYVLAEVACLQLIKKEAEGSVPLWFLRNYLLPNRARNWLDRFGTMHWPNLFGGQVILVVQKEEQ